MDHCTDGEGRKGVLNVGNAFTLSKPSGKYSFIGEAAGIQN